MIKVDYSKIKLLTNNFKVLTPLHGPLARDNKEGAILLINKGAKILTEGKDSHFIDIIFRKNLDIFTYFLEVIPVGSIPKEDIDLAIKKSKRKWEKGFSLLRTSAHYYHVYPDALPYVELPSDSDSSF